ncbi:MAG: hypothetical protein ACLGI2_16235 [Acidimicrobiia bacterium]
MDNVLLATVPTAEAARALLSELLQCSGEAGFKLESATVLERDSSGPVSVEDAAIMEAVIRSVPRGPHAVVAMASERNPRLVDGLVAERGGSLFRRPRPELEQELARLRQAARREHPARKGPS